MDKLLYARPGSHPWTLWLPRPGRCLARSPRPYRRFCRVVRTVHLKDAVDICVRRSMPPRPVTSCSSIRQSKLRRDHPDHPCRDLQVLWFGVRSDQDDQTMHDWYGNVEFSFLPDVFLNHFKFFFLVEMVTAPTHTMTRLLITNTDYSDALDPYSPYQAGGPWYVDARGEHFALENCARFNDEGFNRHPHELEFMVEMTPFGQQQILKEAEISFRNHEAATDFSKPRVCHRFQRFSYLHQGCPWAVSAAVASQMFFSHHQMATNCHPDIASPRLSALADYFRQCYLMAEQSKMYPWLVVPPEPGLQQMLSTLSPVNLNDVEEKLWSASTAKVLLQVGDQFHVVDRNEFFAKYSLFTGSRVKHLTWRCITWDVIGHIYRSWVLTHEVCVPFDLAACNGYPEGTAEYSSTETQDNSFFQHDLNCIREQASSERCTRDIYHPLPDHDLSVSQQQPNHYRNASQPHAGHHPNENQSHSDCQQTGTLPNLGFQQNISCSYPGNLHQPPVSCHQSAKQHHDYHQETTQQNASCHQDKARAHIKQEQNIGQRRRSRDKRADSSQRPPSNQASRGLSQNRSQACTDVNIIVNQPHNAHVLKGKHVYGGSNNRDQYNNKICPDPHDKTTNYPQPNCQQQGQQERPPPRPRQNGSCDQGNGPAPSCAQILKTPKTTKRKKPQVIVKQVQDVVYHTALSRSYAKTLTLTLGHDVTLTQREVVRNTEPQSRPQSSTYHRIVFRNSPERQGSSRLFMYVTNLHPDTEKQEFEELILSNFPRVKQINARKCEMRHDLYCSFTAVIKGDGLFEEDFMDAWVFPPPIHVNIEQWKPGFRKS
ncbi:uncharacterized protein LOC125047416 [Penaeus chinensis]|uniref:uncharacterized protein LOC125047416 n=1 Tax=Penaeus chinensis TaxID=139456 RepID=UPI001FB58F43|nr:uncharacterized protein LOC125047416 [Penaeus chinensis]